MGEGAAGRLALGTAQLGLHYGVANRAGRVSSSDAAGIVGEARRAGIDTIDTAAAYGESEAVLGEAGVGGFHVVTKLPAIPGDAGDLEAWFERSLAASLARLRVERVYGLLLHKPQDLLTEAGGRLYDLLLRARASGRVRKIGVSIYSPRELDELRPAFPLDLVQAPFNVFDRRIEASGWMRRLKADGAELHARSAFLQGLLLMPPSDRPARFARWATLWRAWDEWLEGAGLTALQACVGFVLAHAEVDRLVVGVDSVAHLAEIVASAAPLAELPGPVLSSDALDLIEPSRWSAA
jgi:aryl-alcohol dehydrogenase-like predicted oxidoreductase